MFPPHRIGVAVSGGADSVCLLHVLLELAPRYGLNLSVLHLNHNLRGDESSADAEFVRDLAARLALPFYLEDLHLALEVGSNLEQVARQCRLDFFHERIASGTVDRVATGHTRSDQAETVLFRFLRGSGTAGLAAVLPVTRGGIVRPLIDIDRSEVIDYLRAHDLTWREDSTNASSRFARNRIRHDLLPQLVRDWNPGITETLAHTADWALAEEAWWRSEIDRLAAEHFTAGGNAVLVRAAVLRDLPLATARRLVRRALEQVKGNLRGVGFHHVEAVLALAVDAEGGATRLPGVVACRSFDWVRFAHPVPNPVWRLPLSIPGSTPIPGTVLWISLEIVDNSETSRPSECVYNNGMGWLDWKLLPGSPTLRNWRPGDRYQPIGSPGEKKLKDLFQEARVPIWERAAWPVLEVAGRIIWSRRFGPAAWCAAGTHSPVILQVREVAR
jgi:tRNA(Ile)-lysidine synthase